MASSKQYALASGVVRYQAVVRIEGKYHQRARGFLTSSAAKAAAAEEELLAKHGVVSAMRGSDEAPVTKRMTFCQYAELEIAASTAEEATIIGAEFRHKIIKRFLKDVRLDELSLTRSKALMAQLNGLQHQDGRPYSPGYIRSIWDQFARYVREAQNEGLVKAGVLPPTKKLNLPRARKTSKVTLLTQTEKKALFSTVHENYPAWYAFTLLIFHCGLRANEALSLMVSDVDIRGRRILISKTFSRSRNPSGRKIKRTKESKEDREMVIPVVDAAVLLALKDWIGIRPSDSPLFPGRDGKAAVYRNVLDYVWKPAAKMAGLPPLGFHIARHQMCSEMIMAGINDYVIIARSRHATPALLHTTYGHLYPKTHDTELAKLAVWEARQVELEEAEALRHLAES